MTKPITIRRTLVLSFVLVVGTLALVLLGTTFLTARTAAEEQAARLIERKLREIERSGQQHFQPVESILTFASAWRAKAQCNTDEDLQAIFDTLVKAAPQIAAVRIEAFGVFQEADFEPDPVRWTKPHVLEGGHGLGMSAYTLVDLPSGTRAMVAVDVPLDAISRFTMAYDVTPRTRVITLYREKATGGEGGGPEYAVVGLPGEPRFEDPQVRAKAMLKRARDLDLPYVAAALGAFRKRGLEGSEEPVSFEVNGDRWWAGFRRYVLDEGVHMADAVFVPQHDLLATTARLRWFILGASAVAMALAIALAMALARRAGKPIEALVQQTDRIRRGDFSPGEPIPTRIEEVRRLTEAHEEMRGGLEQLVRLEHEMQVARLVQQSTFPKSMPAVPGYQLFGSSVPAEDTGGDTYDLIGVGDLAVLLLADATGHGIGPALTVSQVRAMIRMATRLETDLPSLVHKINDQLCVDLPAGRFITAWVGILDPDAHVLTTFSAGQGPIFTYRLASDTFERTAANAPPLGLMEIEVKLPPPTALAPGDLHVVLSDGFHEAVGPDREIFGEERVQALIREHADASPEAIVAALHEAVDAFTGGTAPDDDRTAVVVKRLKD